jgi:hypothetical protein
MVGDSSFWWYGLLFNLIIGLFILIPVCRRRTDALTAWNLLLLGSIIHIGFGCFEVYARTMHWKELKWFVWNNHEKHWFMLGTAVFYASLLFFYYKVRFPDRLLSNRLAKWPEQSFSVTVFVLSFCLGISLQTPLVQNIPFVREVAINFTHCALATAVTFATVYWWHNRVSPFAFVLLFACLAVAVLDAMILFAGRRLLLTVAFGPIAAMYWLSWRYWSRLKLIVSFGVMAACLLVIAAFYSTFRHTKASEQRNASTVIAKAKSVSTEDVKNQLTDIYHYLAQYTVHYSLLTIRLVDEGRLHVTPLDTLRVIAAYPIPRSIWAEKPRDECQYVSTTVLKMPYKTNWGVGVTGQGYHDGGLVVLVLYAFLASIMVKVFDVPLRRQPDNPFVLAALASASAHIAAWPRGALSAMTLNLVDTLAFILFLAFVSRALFGTARRSSAARPYAWPMPSA